MDGPGTDGGQRLLGSLPGGPPATHSAKGGGQPLNFLHGRVGILGAKMDFPQYPHFYDPPPVDHLNPRFPVLFAPAGFFVPMLIHTVGG